MKPGREPRCQRNWEDFLKQNSTQFPPFLEHLQRVTIRHETCQAAVGDKFGKRLIFTKKKMGAQTAEANDNAGVAAANQIVGFFEKGETRFSLKA